MDDKEIVEAYMSNDPMVEPVNTLPNAPVSQADVDQMRKVLQTFSDVSTNVSSDLVTESRNNTNISEALFTDVNDNKITFDKKYEIRITNEDNKKRYTVISSDGEVIANDLYLYESAYSIVKLLNSGEPPLNAQIRRVIYLEENYSSNRNNAMMMKSRYKKTTNERQADIYAAKYQSARDNALEAKKGIQKILESL